MFSKIKVEISGREGAGDHLYPYGMLFPQPTSVIAERQAAKDKRDEENKIRGEEKAAVEAAAAANGTNDIVVS